MNRIYQGRIRRVEIEGEELPDWQARLWDHHVLFQDAVNYYIVALAALGSSEGSELTQLRERLRAVWDAVHKPGERREGMREGLARRFGIAPQEFTLERAMEIARDGELPDAAEAEKYGELVLARAEGTGGPRNASREFLPKLCWPGFRGNLEGGGAEEAKQTGVARLRAELAGLNTPDELRAFAELCELDWVVKLTPGAQPHKDTAERLRKSVWHFLKAFEPELEKQEATKLGDKTRDWLRTRPDAEETLRAMLDGADGLKEERVPRNGKGVADRTEALLLFKYFPGAFTRDLLQSLFPPLNPAEAGAKEERRSEPGVDAKRARGKRGYAFRAFSTFTFFGSKDAGDFKSSSWGKEFDIAAFKEGLTVVGQFWKNCEKRQAKIERLAARLLLMNGVEGVGDGTEPEVRAALAAAWNDRSKRQRLRELAREEGEAAEDGAWPDFTDDDRVKRLRTIVALELADEEGGAYGLRKRTMKGWEKVRGEWRKMVKAGEAFSERKREKLQAKLNELRTENPEEVGSYRLFESLLADEGAWAIWREPTDAEGEDIARRGWPEDALEAFRRYCETLEELEARIERGVGFTPADAVRSRRLFSFSDACSFGNRGGEFRHEQAELAVVVPLAMADESGCYRRRTARIIYAAPRLLRDRLRTEDGKFVKTWSPPMAAALWDGQTAPVQADKNMDGAAVELMPDWGREGERRFLLNFVLDVSSEELTRRVRELRGQAGLPEKFALGRTGAWNLRWPKEPGDAPKTPWWEHVAAFSVLGVDLGVRQAGAAALVEISSGKSPGANAREIGEAGGRRWHARYRAGTLLRLAGEDRKVWRKPAKGETGSGLGFREELYGSRGRTASATETGLAEALLRDFGYEELAGDLQGLSFPQQNDKLLIAIRWAQRQMAREGRWLWMLSQAEDPGKRQKGLAEISAGQAELVALGSDRLALCAELETRVKDGRERIARALLAATERILPVRGRSWEFVTHPEVALFPNCRLLRLTKAGSGPGDKKIAGQRGLSMARVEQVGELRRRWQSLNQALRRAPGERPPTAAEMRRQSIPDPCPALLRKLEQVREQRVNQTAHLILAEALGVRLRGPEEPRSERARADRHGEYERFRAPVDAIVIENLSRYRTAQGRAHSENTRLMQWCHRQVSAKLKELAEPFGIPVMETPAAYSSQFCSRCGTVGFRAVEVGLADRERWRWRKLLQEAVEKGADASAEAREAARLFGQLEALNAGREKKAQRTLVAPQAGGPVFVAAAGRVAPMQADLNAAINLALRAVAAPDCASIHHRIRTERRAGKQIVSKETRRFGNSMPEVTAEGGKPLGKEKYTNVFFDPCRIAQFGRAQLEGEERFDYATWQALHTRIKELSWERCADINWERQNKWQGRAAGSEGEDF